jgi:ABC-type uncharacterized transport system substrate-binding protein
LAKTGRGLEASVASGNQALILSDADGTNRIHPVPDPVASGFVESLSRPRGNLTGFATNESIMGGKWLELLREIAPHAARIAIIFNAKTGL